MLIFNCKVIPTKYFVSHYPKITEGGGGGGGGGGRGGEKVYIFALMLNKKCLNHSKKLSFWSLCIRRRKNFPVRFYRVVKTRSKLRIVFLDPVS